MCPGRVSSTPVADMHTYLLEHIQSLVAQRSGGEVSLLPQPCAMNGYSVVLPDGRGMAQIRSVFTATASRTAAIAVGSIDGIRIRFCGRLNGLSGRRQTKNYVLTKGGRREPRRLENVGSAGNDDQDSRCSLRWLLHSPAPP